MTLYTRVSDGATVEAVQYDGTNLRAIVGLGAYPPVFHPGDWAVKGKQRSVWRVPAELFPVKYQPA